MVAYSFNGMFVDPLFTRRKIGTIRADRKRHARVGEEVQCYQGMRTRSCRLLGRAQCQRVIPIWLDFTHGVMVADGPGPNALRPIEDLDAFAQGDGFNDWQQMRTFWAVARFYGVWIVWNDTFEGAL